MKSEGRRSVTSWTDEQQQQQLMRCVTRRMCHPCYVVIGTFWAMHIQPSPARMRALGL